MPFDSSPSFHRRSRDGGFTYLGLLIMLALIAMASAATLQVGAVMQRHAAEEELLEIGAEFRSALASYADATPVGMSRAPHTLQDLVKDERYAKPRHHLRKLYADPLTGTQDWGVVKATDGSGSGIVGVYSLAPGKPIKIGNFDAIFQTFTRKKSYRDWIFAVAPPQITAPAIPAAPAASVDPATSVDPAASMDPAASVAPVTSIAPVAPVADAPETR